MQISSEQFGSIGTFCHGKLYTKTGYSSIIFISFINYLEQIVLILSSKKVSILFANNIYWEILEQFCTSISLWILGSKCVKMCCKKISLVQDVSIIFVNNIWNTGTVWHRKLYLKTWYSSKYLGIVTIFVVWYLVPQCHREENF